MSDEFALTFSIDPYQYLQITPNDDGTLTRNYTNLPSTLHSVAPTPDHLDDQQTLIALSKDVTINKSNGLSVRIFLHAQALDSSSSTNNNKLPVIVYFHGGGFILFSTGTSISHDFCSNIAAQFPAVIVSVDYRLAPEHRLPAAYDDAMEALHWIKTTNDDWIINYADLSSCFLMGTSAGGNIVYYSGLRVASEVDDDLLLPLKIKGLILHSAFFGGINRTESELRLENNMHLPLCVNDLMWKLALPIGAGRDHEYCDPTVGGGSKLLEKIKLLGWRVMVSGCDGDPLIDRQIELAKIIKQKGVQLVSHFVEGGFHSCEIIDASKPNQFIDMLKDFILSSTVAAGLVSE